MTDTQIQSTPEIAELLAERNRIWKEYDLAMQRAQEAKNLGHKVSAGGSADSIPPLTQENLPPEEIVATLKELQDELTQISGDGKQINRRNSDIQAIRNRATQIYIACGLAIVVIIVVLWVLIA